MNVQDIIDLARDQTYTTVSQMPDVILLKYLNIVKDEFFSYLITALDQSYNWDYFTSNTVINQDEYTFPEVAFDSAGMLQLKELYISYKWETYDDWSIKYTKATQIWQSNLPKDWNWYRNNQPIEKPIYFIADRSVFIAPAPKEVVISWIQARWIKNIPNYTLATTEQNLKIPVPYQHILIQGLLPYIYKKIGKKNDASFELWEYVRKRTEIIRELSERQQWPHLMAYPNNYETTNIFS